MALSSLTALASPLRIFSCLLVPTFMASVAARLSSSVLVATLLFHSLAMASAASYLISVAAIQVVIVFSIMTICLSAIEDTPSRQVANRSFMSTKKLCVGAAVAGQAWVSAQEAPLGGHGR